MSPGEAAESNSGSPVTTNVPRPSSVNVATSPEARKPNRKFSPTTIRLGCSGAMIRATNSSGLHCATSAVKSTTSTRSTPQRANSRLRSARLLNSRGA